jgi:chromosomal replication initiation ATPase DnaA
MERNVEQAPGGWGRNAPSRAGSQRRLSNLVAEAFGLCGCDLDGATRGCAQVALARQAAMYLARVCLGLTLSQAASLFGRDRTTAAHACRVIEDRRDDPVFDAKLAAIEAMLARDPEALR